jgi:hypothetical protein
MIRDWSGLYPTNLLQCAGLIERDEDQSDEEGRKREHTASKRGNRSILCSKVWTIDQHVELRTDGCKEYQYDGEQSPEQSREEAGQG